VEPEFLHPVAGAVRQPPGPAGLQHGDGTVDHAGHRLSLADGRVVGGVIAAGAGPQPHRRCSGRSRIPPHHHRVERLPQRPGHTGTWRAPPAVPAKHQRRVSGVVRGLADVGNAGRVLQPGHLGRNPRYRAGHPAAGGQLHGADIVTGDALHRPGAGRHRVPPHRRAVHVHLQRHHVPVLGHLRVFRPHPAARSPGAAETEGSPGRVSNGPGRGAALHLAQPRPEGTGLALSGQQLLRHPLRRPAPVLR